jgi:flagellar hook protein FlgE
MTPVSSIALSGMQAAQMQLNASANNVANAQTEGFQRRQVQQIPEPGGGVSARDVASTQPGPQLEADLVNQLQAKNSFLANLAVFKTSNAIAGVLLDQKV